LDWKCKFFEKGGQPIVSEAALASARYSASVEDRATVLCFLDVHEMGLGPKKLMYIDVDVRSSTFLAQSASEYVCNTEGPTL
jgi:hypothetical protein